MKRVGVSTLALVFVFGCANLKSITSGQIGCSPEDIRITEEEAGQTSKNWVAECRGKRFHCTEASAGHTIQFYCTEEISVTNAVSEQGCQFDTQCKGDRICEDEKCISP